jgi:hypothetical protein
MTWKKIGQVAIDSGSLLLCDPCNAAEQAGLIINAYEQGRRPQYNTVLATLTETGLGDGIYDVMAKMRAGRVAEIQITFMAGEQRASDRAA